MKTKINPLTIDDLLKIFRTATKCEVQYHRCPCATCMATLDADYQHIVWLILLGMRGDYDRLEIIPNIQKALKKKGRHSG